MKLGSLFDGSGGFPLAGVLCGVVPVWAAEVEPYPIAVTRSRFPSMRHLGDISKVSGADIEPVDIITFGSPCQDLSVAGKRAGLKHEANGDDETTRSGLFMEAVRIIKEMRKATNGVYPRFALWENVPGAFSSNKGEDFRIVCEELIKVVEPRASMPSVPQKGWPYSDSYSGDGWSLAYRVFDAQYWGVPQRRRRIHLVVDFRGQCAREVLFEREGVRGYFAQGRTPWQSTPSHTQDGSGADDRAGESAEGSGGRQLDAVSINGEVAGTLDASYYKGCGLRQGVEREVVAVAYTLKVRSGCDVDSAGKAAGKGALIQTEKAATLACVQDQYLFQPMVYDARGNGDGTSSSTITGDHENRITDYTSVVVEPTVSFGIDQGATRDVGKLFLEEQSKTLTNGTCPGHHNGVVVAYGTDVGPINSVNHRECEIHYIVRRLTPTECARLQGFADQHGHLEQKTDLTDEEYSFWLEVRNTHAAINGKPVKDYTKPQMLAWYNRLWTDGAEYKMWGNGIALPPALYCMQGIVDALNKEEDDSWML